MSSIHSGSGGTRSRSDSSSSASSHASSASSGEHSPTTSVASSHHHAHAAEDEFKAKGSHPAEVRAHASQPKPPSPSRRQTLSSSSVHSVSTQTAIVRPLATAPAGPSRSEAKPTEYQEHFYDLGSVIVDPSHRALARSLGQVLERKEGLKMYCYEPRPGELYAISHAASEAGREEGKSTQHQELQKALLFGVAKGNGRFATDDPKQRTANKSIARAFTDKKPHPAHGGLRLQMHNGRPMLDVSSAFSFHGASDASMQQIARFYANVLKHTEGSAMRVGVLPAEASCHPQYCIEAAPHLQDLARRIEQELADD